MMVCPSCRRGLPGGPNERCPFCAAVLAAPVQGALAPDLQESRPRMEPMREIPGLRKRERTWKDEVRDRVRERRSVRGGGLPLFPEGEAEGEPEPERRLEPAPAPAGPAPAFASMAVDDVPLQPVLRDAPAAAEDVPLRPAPFRPESAPPAREAREREWTFDDEPEPGPPVEAPPVERPASPADRARAAAIDLALLVPIWAVSIYGAARAARVGLAGLLPAWPWLVAYCAFLGLLYAGYFTGIAGRTVGKRITGLTVLGPGDVPPGWRRALVRAALGACGVLAAGLGLATMLVDPARRALHDRLLRTRVVKG
jgi:uncharacterized RDD family membrane protein YckC